VSAYILAALQLSAVALERGEILQQTFPSSLQPAEREAMATTGCRAPHRRGHASRVLPRNRERSSLRRPACPRPMPQRVTRVVALSSIATYLRACVKGIRE